MNRAPQPRHRRARGFTLAELAIVLVVIGLLTGGMLGPLASRLEARQRQETSERLRDIEQALYGFAILHGRLPCPSTEPDPGSAGYGRENAPPCDDSVEGMLPWRTLGLGPVDAWGTPRSSPTAPWPGHWRYRVDRAFAAAGGISAATVPLSNLQLYDHDNRPITVESESRAVAIVYSTGNNLRADGLNASYSATHPRYQAGEATASFDDLLIWIGHPLLIARLAQAGRL